METSSIGLIIINDKSYKIFSGYWEREYGSVLKVPPTLLLRRCCGVSSHVRKLDGVDLCRSEKSGGGGVKLDNLGNNNNNKKNPNQLNTQGLRGSKNRPFLKQKQKRLNMIEMIVIELRLTNIKTKQTWGC